MIYFNKFITIYFLFLNFAVVFAALLSADHNYTTVIAQLWPKKGENLISCRMWGKAAFLSLPLLLPESSVMTLKSC